MVDLDFQQVVMGVFGAGTIATGAAGGGSSAVANGNTIYLVVAGGGGSVFSAGGGGSGGCQNGQNGVSAGPPPPNIGGGATGAIGGTGAAPSTPEPCDLSGSNGLSAGQGGQGGAGSSAFCLNSYNGGGGGGGYAGAGGGGTCHNGIFSCGTFGGAGGGGSSYFPNGICQQAVSDFTNSEKSVGKADPYYNLAYSGSGGGPTTNQNTFMGTQGQVVIKSDVNECSQFLPCQHGGTCINTWGSFYCICAEGYSGNLCQISSYACGSNPCQNGATCVDSIPTQNFTCDCVPGTFGTLCQTNLDECVSQPCLHGGTCVDQIGGYTCDCISGYGGSQCQSEINECASQPCQNGGICNEQFNGFNCSCLIGFNGTLCENNINECASDPCLNSGTCVDGINVYTCQCLVGISGTNCETIPSNPSVSNLLNFPTGNVITFVSPRIAIATPSDPQVLCFPLVTNATDCRYPALDLAAPTFSGIVIPQFVTFETDSYGLQCAHVTFESLFYLVVRAALPLVNCTTLTECEPLNALVFKDCNETPAKDWWKTGVFIGLMSGLAGIFALVLGVIAYFTYTRDAELIPDLPADGPEVPNLPERADIAPQRHTQRLPPDPLDQP